MDADSHLVEEIQNIMHREGYCVENAKAELFTENKVEIDIIPVSVQMISRGHFYYKETRELIKKYKHSSYCPFDEIDGLFTKAENCYILGQGLNLLDELFICRAQYKESRERYSEAGNYYEKAGDDYLNNALKNYSLDIMYRENINAYGDMADSYAIMGELYVRQTKYIEALEHYNCALYCIACIDVSTRTEQELANIKIKKSMYMEEISKINIELTAKDIFDN